MAENEEANIPDALFPLPDGMISIRVENGRLLIRGTNQKRDPLSLIAEGPNTLTVGFHKTPRRR